MKATRSKSMNYAESKGSCKRLITQNKFKTLEEADKFLATEVKALQTSCGLTFLERSKIIIDIDRENTLKGHLEEYKQKITDVTGIKWSTYSYNVESKHVQFAIYLKNEDKFVLKDNERTLDHSNCLQITRKLNLLVGGDLRFNGWQCRNHYYSSKKYKTKITDYKISKKELEDKILSSNICYSSSIFDSYSFTDFSKIQMKQNETEINKKIGKQYHEIKECHNFYEKNKNCSELEMINNLLEKEIEIAKITNSKPHSKTEVINRAKSCYKWLKKHFDVKKSSNYNKFHSSTRTHNKNVKALLASELREKNKLTASKISSKLNVSIRTVFNYFKQIKENVEETVKEIQKTVSQKINLNFENLCWLIQPSLSKIDLYSEKFLI